MKQAIIIPIYIGHRARFSSLLESYKPTLLADYSLIFIATNLREKIYFSTYAYLKKKHVTVLNFEKLAKEFINVDSRELNNRLRASTGIINLKKLLGLMACFSRRYESAVVVDSDILFFDDFNGNNFFESCKNNYRKKVFYGAVTSDLWLEKIVRNCLQFLHVESYFGKNKCYSWFFDVPYYESSEFNDFLTYIDQLYGAEWWIHINSLTFDHLLFQYFLVAQKGWKLEDYSNVSRSIPELLSPSEFVNVAESKDYWPTWASYQSICSMPDLKTLNPNLQLKYHIDR